MSVKLYNMPFRTRLRPWEAPFLALFMALGLFIGTIYALPLLSTWGVNALALKAGTVAAMGVTPNSDTFQGSILQKAAFENPRILPLYGSSEMSMIYEDQPAEILTPETGITPFLVGRGGTQDLIHVLNIAALGKEVHGKKLAIFLTPQWFSSGGISEDTFASNFSALHVYELLQDRTLSVKLKSDAAQRLLQFSKAYQDFPYLKKVLALQGKKDLSSQISRLFYALPAQMEYTALALDNAGRTAWQIKQLPTQTVARYASPASAATIQPQWNKLRTAAIEQAKKSTDNNPFDMDNGFYTSHILPILQTQKNSNKSAKYSSSPEYGDLQLLMDVLKEKGAQPLFVILPMNGDWADYTGIPAEERQIGYQKIAQMIQTEGFALADFSSHEKDDYYLRDPWHLAWQGWIDVDEALYQFYQSK